MNFLGAFLLRVRSELPIGGRIQVYKRDIARREVER